MLRQALQELNEEKNIKEGMPHYRQKLISDHNKQMATARTIEQKVLTVKQKSYHSKGMTTDTRSSLINTITTTKQKNSLRESKNEYILPKNGGTPLSPCVIQEHTQGNGNANNVQVVSCFSDSSNNHNINQQQQLQAQLSQKKTGTTRTLKNPNHPLQQSQTIGNKQTNKVPKGPPRQGAGSTKCASSNSNTNEPSTNNIMSLSMKSSLITTPKSASVVAITQQDLKDKTKEPNLIVCLYYNLACCYQRLGLLEESVEYLELASDQLEDIVQFFELQEEVLIKSRRLQQTNQGMMPPIQTLKGKQQYHTEQPNRASNLTNLDQQTPQQKFMNRQQAEGTPSQNANKNQQVIVTKRKELKRDKISIKDCQPHVSRQDVAQKGLGGTSLESLSKLIRHSEQHSVLDHKKSDNNQLGNSNLLQRMSQGATQLLQTKEAAAAMLQLSTDRLQYQQHNSAEQLMQTTSKASSSLIPSSGTKANQLQFASFTNNYSSIIEKQSSSGRNVSPVTTTSVPPESTTVFSIKNSPTGAITIEQLLAEKMHKARYQCKMNLQICALQSQLGKHQDALIYGKRAAAICYKLIKSAQMLCKRYVMQIQRHIQARQAKAAAVNQQQQLQQNQLIQGANKSNKALQQLTASLLPDQNSSGESPVSRQQNNGGNYSSKQRNQNNLKQHKAYTEINDSFDDDYQAAQFYRKAPKTRMETVSNSSYLDHTGKKSSKANSSLKRPRSSCSSASHSSTASQRGLTRLRLQSNSISKLLQNQSQKEMKTGSRSSRESSRGTVISQSRASSTESLDRIHTFNLKNSAAATMSNTVVDGKPEASLSSNQKDLSASSVAIGVSKQPSSVYQNLGPETSTQTNQEVFNGLKVSMVDGLSIAKELKSSQMKLTKVEETELRAYTEDADLVIGTQEAGQSQSQHIKQKDQQQQNFGQDNKEGISQSQLSIMLGRNVYVEESVKVLESLIIQADPLLQELASIVKEFEDKAHQSAIDRDQDMIKKYGQQDFRDRRKRLRISFTSLQELISIEKDQRFKLNVRNNLGVKNTQDWIFNLNIGNVMHLNMMKEQELNAKIENTHELTKDTMLEKVVLITSSYFCIATEIRFILQKDLLDVKQISKKDSESYHAKALHVALLFLPEDCPLSQYINQTYCKNYLQPKLKLQKQRNAYISQKMAKQHQTRQKQLQKNQEEKKATEQSSQQHHSYKRPPISALLKELGPAYSGKLLIQTKSYEGLASADSTDQLSQIGPGQKTVRVGAYSSAKEYSNTQTTITPFRKTGIPLDVTINKKSKGSSLNSASKPSKGQPQKTSVAEQSLTAKISKVLGAANTTSKKVKKASGALSTHYRKNSGTSYSYQPNNLMSQTKRAVKSPTPPKSSKWNSVPQQGSNQYTAAAAEIQPSGKPQKIRESSSVRKIKIDLGLICGQTSERKNTQLQNHHRRSSSLRRFPQKIQIHSGKTGPSTNALQKPMRKKQSLASLTSSVTALMKLQQHPQMKQSMGDCSLSNTTGTALTSTQHQSSTTLQQMQLAQSASQTMKVVLVPSQKASGTQMQHQQQKQQQRLIKQSPMPAMLVDPAKKTGKQAVECGDAQTNVKQSQQSVMMAALKILKLKQTNGYNNANNNKKQTTQSSSNTKQQ